MDTRTPRTPTGGRSSTFDDEPVLSSVKVPCDPAQVIVNHASFRVRLPVPVVSGALADTTRIPVLRGAAPAARRRPPVVWSGRTDSADAAEVAATTELLHAVRQSGVRTAAARADGPGGGLALPAGATQVLPRLRPGDGGPDLDRLERTGPVPSVVSPRDPAEEETSLLRGVRATEGAFDHLYTPAPRSGDAHDRTTGCHPADGRPDGGYEGDGHDGPGYEGYAEDTGARGFGGRLLGRRQNADAVRHAYYPGRRMNLGVVLLPLRVFLGFISVYAGMGKLCDPVYFDGGERGSMVTWLSSLHPWALAAPLRDFALAHPVGAGLTVAFLQVVVGVLTMCGLWQRAAAVVGGLLSLALLVTVTWRTVPVYDAPDIIYLAAWSPLVIAGAPVYSLDARLAGEAWRTLGPRVEVYELRRRVLRRGAVMASVIAGLTLLVGSLLGGAVRSASVPTVPGPGEPPVNNLQGSPLPQERKKDGARLPEGSQTEDARRRREGATAGPSPSGHPSSAASTAPGASHGAAGAGGTTAPSTGGAPQQSVPRRQPSAPQQPTAGGAGGGGGSTGGAAGGTSGSGSGEGGGSDGGSGSSGGHGALSGLLGG